MTGTAPGASDYRLIQRLPGGEATAIVRDNEVAPVLSFTLFPSEASEGGSLRVRLEGEFTGAARAEDTVFELTVGGSGDTALSVADYSIQGGAFPPLVINAGEKALPGFFFNLLLVQDRIDEGDSEVLSIVANQVVDAGEQAVIAPASAVFTITDDDRAGIAVPGLTARQRTLAAGDTLSYEMMLTSQPAASVDVVASVATVANSSAMVSDLTASVASLTFTQANWDTPQSIVFNVAASLTMFGELRVRHAVTSTDANYNGRPVASIGVTLVNIGLVVSPMALEVAEGGSGTYQVSLVSQPDAAVTVQPEVPAGLSVAPAALTFDGDTWQTPLIFTVTAADNNLSDGERALIIVNRGDAIGTTSNYENVPSAPVEVTVTDNDPAPTQLTLTLEPDVNIGESGGVVELNLVAVLNNSPFAVMKFLFLTIEDPPQTTAAATDFAITTIANTPLVPGAEASVQFPAGQNRLVVPLRITPTPDRLDEEDEIIVLAVELETTALETSINLTIVDDDTAAINVGLSAQPIRAGEELVYTVQLTSQPTADVVFAVSVLPAAGSAAKAADVTLSPTSWTFTPGTWDTPQMITFTVADPLMTFGELLLRHQVTTSDANYGAISVSDIPITLVDVGLVVSPLSLDLAEGATGSYEVSLISQPDGRVIVHTEAPAGLRVTPAVLTFNIGGWDTAQVVTVTAIENTLADGDRLLTIVNRVEVPAGPSGGTNYEGAPSVPVGVTVEDDDPAPTQVTLTLEPPGGANVPESGSANVPHLVVELNNSPFAVAKYLTLTINVSDTAAAATDFAIEVFPGTADAAPLGLTDMVSVQIPAELNRFRVPIRITPTPDRLDEEDENIAIVASVEDVAASDFVLLTIVDDDEAGIDLVGLNRQNVREGDEVVWTVALRSQPTEDVMVAVSVSAVTGSSAMVSDVTLSSTSLTFTSGTWETPQTVMLTVAGSLTTFGGLQVQHKGTSSDADYSGRTAAPVEVTLVDVGLVVLPASLELDEGGAGSYQVKLISQPDSGVTVHIEAPAGEGLSVNPAALTFDSNTWDTAQEVQVTAAENDLSSGDRVLEIANRVEAAGDYANAPSFSVVVTLADDEKPPVLRLTLIPSAAVEGNGGSQSQRDVPVTLRALFTGPARSDDTVFNLATVGAGDTAVWGVDYNITSLPPDLTIAAGQKMRDIEFTLQLVQDGFDEGAAETLSITASQFVDGGGEAVIDPASAVFRIVDDDTVGILVGLRSRNVRKENVLVYEVVLTSEPRDDVVIAVSITPPAGITPPSSITFDQTPLTFTSMTWSERQTVSLTVATVVAEENLGDYVIGHSVTSTDDTDYNQFPIADRTLGLIDVELSLALLELRLERADAAPLTLTPEDGGAGFDPTILAYSASIPFDAGRLLIRAVPMVSQTLTVDGTVGGEPVQNPAEVHLFSVPAGAGDGDPIGLDSTVRRLLPRDQDKFEFRVRVSVQPLPASDDPVELMTYTLTLNRALPAEPRLEVFLASDTERTTRTEPVTELAAFRADEDEVELILVVRAGAGSYAIEDVMLAGMGSANVELELVAEEETPPDRVFEFETRVRLQRANPGANPQDIDFAVMLTATPERPLAAGDEAPTAELRGTLLADSPTVTEINATYRGHDQPDAAPDAAVPAGGEIRVSDNGPATITLEVVRTGGGVRPFNRQASFTLEVIGAGSRLTRVGNSFGITAGPMLTLAVNAIGVDLENIDNPPDLIFTVVFEEPSAAIRPQAGAAPLFNYYSELGDARPLFAFVGEENQLPLAVALDEDSTPLADGILGDLPLTVTVTASRPGDVTLSLSAVAPGELPSRELLFEVAQPQTNVAVEVSVAEVDVDSRVVIVAPLNFVAHLLRLEHEPRVALEQEPMIILPFSLEDELMDGAPGLNPGSSWTLAVANEQQLADHGYEVEEVIPIEVLDVFTQISTTLGVSYTKETITRTFGLDGGVQEIRTAPAPVETSDISVTTLNQFSAQLSMQTETVVLKGTYVAANADVRMRPGLQTRTLRLRRTDGPAVTSRLVLTFDYSPAAAGVPSGSFNRVVTIAGGSEPVPEARIFAAGRELAAGDVVVLPRGGSALLELVVSNLPGEDGGVLMPQMEDVVFRNHQDLVITRGQGELDEINRRYVLPLTVTLAENAAGPNYDVSITVPLAGRPAVAASFRVDVNDPPQYDSNSPIVLEVEESGGTETVGIVEFPLRIVDPDGGLQPLDAADLMLEVVGFTGPFAVSGASETGVPYFDLEFSTVQASGDDSGNALDLILTLTGKLATPFGAVVELRLFGATDGYEVLDQRLSVRVSHVESTFDLETMTTPLLAGEVPTEVLLSKFTDGSRDGAGAHPTEVLVLDAPPHLLVRYDAADRQTPVVTIRNLDPANLRPQTVRLVAFDSQGDRKEVVLTINPVRQLPEIEAPHPLLVVAGAMAPAVRRVMFVGNQPPDVAWTVSGEPANVTATPMKDDRGAYVDVEVTASLAVAAGTEFVLELTATDNGHDQRRTVKLPVVVVAADSRPRLNLSVKAASDEAGTDKMTISSFIATDTLFLFVEALPDGVGLDPLTATIRIDSITSGTLLWQTTTVRALALAAQPISVLLPPAALTALVADDLLQVSITILAATGAVAQDSLRYRVRPAETAVEAVKDSDNDGLPDMADDENAGAADLGPIAAALASTTDAQLRPDLELSLGHRARSVGLGGCGVVSLMLDLDTGGIVNSLMGCGVVNFAEFPSSNEIQTALTAGDFAAGDGYRLFDLRVTFDSSATDDDDLVLLSLPAHPSPDQFYRVHRFDGTELVPALSAALPAALSAAPGGLAQVNDCNTCLYAVDGDRDGSVELLLLLESVQRPPEFSSSLLKRVAVLALPAGGDATATPVLSISLAELFGEALLNGTMTPDVRVTQVTGSGNVTGELEEDRANLRLIGLKHTPMGPEEVRIELLDGTVPVSTLILQFSVPNRPPVVTFLLDGVETTSLMLFSRHHGDGRGGADP